jgi:8-oxo-dGTP pyrophosphatase MutT (NUDIX family)
MRSLDPIHKVLSAGLVVVHNDGERYRLLTLRTFGGWDFPKALVADGADPLQVAVRETSEATGIDDLELNWGDESRETVAYDDGSVSRYYMAQSKSMEVELRVPAGAGSEEDYGFAWLTADEAEDVLPPRLAIVLDWAVRLLISSARAS